MCTEVFHKPRKKHWFRGDVNITNDGRSFPVYSWTVQIIQWLSLMSKPGDSTLAIQLAVKLNQSSNTCTWRGSDSEWFLSSRDSLSVADACSYGDRNPLFNHHDQHHRHHLEERWVHFNLQQFFHNTLQWSHVQKLKTFYYVFFLFWKKLCS